MDQNVYTDITEKPADGCYVHGLYLEAASWNSKKHHIEQPKPKELYSSVPMM